MTASEKGDDKKKINPYGIKIRLYGLNKQLFSFSICMS